MDLLNQFKDFLFSQKDLPAKVTVKNYVADISQFIRWFEHEYQKTFSPSLVNSQTIEQYKQSKSQKNAEPYAEQRTNFSVDPRSVPHSSALEIQKTGRTPGSPLSPRSVERHMSSLRKFFKFLKLEGQIASNPFEMVNGKSSMVNVPDPWHIKDFKNFLYVYNASHLTIKNYIIDTRQFFTWAEEVLNLSMDNGSSRLEEETGGSRLENLASNFKHQNPTSSFQRLASKNVLNAITPSLLEEYKNRLVNEGNFSPSTVNRKLSSLRKYLNWAAEEGLLGKNLESKVQNLELGKADARNVRLELQQFSNKTIEQLPENRQSSIVNRQSYSGFPPLRLAQKVSKIGIFAFDLFLTIPFAKAFDKVSYLTWLAKGRPVFTEARKSKLEARIPTSIFQLLNPASGFKHQASKVKNLPKEFYAPLDISTKYFPWYKKAWFTLRYKRPKWYTTYHSYPIAHYFNFAVLIIFMAVIGFGFYQSFFQKPTTGQPTLAAGLPNAPLHILSFQGRLTDNQDNPISTSSAMRFAIYNAQAPATGSALLWQEVNSVSPDQDGIFSILLGNVSPIPQWLFASNSALFLGVTVNVTPELTPRQQLATVAFAANSELLQGLPPITQAAAGTSNVVLALDSSGNLTIGGSANPTFQASGGQFTISGQPLLLTTNTGTNGNIQLAPDGTGFIDLAKPIVNTSNSNNIASAVGSVEIDDLLSVLATSSGQSAVTINQTGGGPLISASQSGTAKFTVDGSGNTTIASGSIYSVGTSTGLSLSNACVNTTGGIVTGTGTCPAQTGTNWWNQLAGALSPVNTTNDLLLGSTATSSALFSFTGVKTGQTIASVSGNLIVMPNNGWGGQVGIGTTGPLSVLDMYKTGSGANSKGATFRDNVTPTYAANADNLLSVRGTGSSVSTWRGRITAGGDTNEFIMGEYNSQAWLGAHNAALNAWADFYINPDGGMKTFIGSKTNAGNTILTIDNATGNSYFMNGNVGIGTTSPGQKLVVGDITGQNTARINGLLTANMAPVVSLFRSAAAEWVMGGYGNSINDFSIGVNPASYTDANLASAAKLTILNGGNVGIGTTNPGAKLDVSGTIQTNSQVLVPAGVNLTSNPGYAFTGYPNYGFYLDTNSGYMQFVGNGVKIGGFYRATSTGFGFNNGSILAWNGPSDGTPDVSIGRVGVGVLGIGTAAGGNTNGTLIANTIGIGTTSPTAPLHINSGYANNAALIVNNLNSGDLFVASASGTTKFELTNAGAINLIGGQTSDIDTLTGTTLKIGASTATTLTLGRSGQGITLPGFTAQNGVLYGTQTTGVLAQATTASTGQCLLSGASNPSWSACPASAPTSDLYWNQQNGSLFPNNSTVDLLVGGQATTSAKFAVLNVNSGNATATVSGQFVVMPNNGWGGQVGVGVTSPSEKLQVNGNAIIGNTALGGTVSDSSPFTFSTAADAQSNTTSALYIAPTTSTNHRVFLGTSSRAVYSLDFTNVTTGIANVNSLQGPGGGTQYTFNSASDGTYGVNPLDITPNIDNTRPALIRNTRVTDGATSIGFVLKTNNALSNTTSKFLVLDNAGTSLVTVLGGGNVGIGLTNPLSALQVQGDISIPQGNRLYLYPQFASSSLYRNSGTGNTVLTYPNTSAFTVLANDSSEVFRINTTGNVGIGTTAPNSLLDVQGAPAGKALANFNYTGTDQNILTASASGTTQFYLTNAGSIYARSFYDLDNPAYFLDPAATALGLNLVGSASMSGNLAFNGTGTNSVYALNGGNLNFQVSPSGTTGTGVNSALYIQNTGNVGIGTVTPNAGLHVASNVIFQNASDSTTAFQVLNSAGDSLLTADTSGSKITLNPVGAYSDEFNTGGPTAGSRWSFVTNDASTYSVNSAAAGKLRISTADTTKHDCWASDTTCLRLVQTPPTGDFQADVKLDTLPPNGSGVYSGLGILVYKDATNFLRLELQSYGDGTNWIVRGYKIIANVGSTAVSSATLAGLTAPFYIRVKRTADTWTLYYSTDGNSFTTVGSFSQALDLSAAGAKIGPELDNYPAGTTFAYADFDYFHLTTAAGTILQVNGGAVFQNTLDSTTAFQIKNAAGTGVLAVDTTNQRVGIGTTSPSRALTVGPYNAGFDSTGYVYTKRIYPWDSASAAIFIDSAGGVGIGNAAPITGLTVTGNVGIGDTTPSFKLDVADTQATTYVAQINNLNTSNTADGLIINLGVANASRGTGNYFIGFAGAGTVAGKIQGGASAVAYTTTAADYAEYFRIADINNKPEPGDLISLSTIGKSAEKSLAPSHAIGVFSTNPGFIGNGPLCDQNDNDCDSNYAKYNVLVGLSGQITTKVSAINGPIKPGDPLTASTIAGVAVKATSAGFIVGHALEAYSQQETGKIKALISPSWYDPDVYLTSTGDLNIASSLNTQNGQTAYSLRNTGNNLIQRAGAFSQLISADIRAGSARIEQLSTNSLAVVTENITIGGQSLRNYIASIVSEQLSNIQNLTSNNIVSPIASIDQIHTNLISPLAQDSKIALKLENDKLSILNGNSATASAVSSFDNQGNATFSGTLAAKGVQSSELRVQNDATVSGTLHAGKIIADDIVGLNIQAATVSANYITNVTNIYNSSPAGQLLNGSIANIATGSSFPTLAATPQQSSNSTIQQYISISPFASELAYVGNLNASTATFSQGLMSFGPTSLSDTSIVGQLSIDGNLILASNSINVLGGDLQLQPLKQGGLSVMAGLFYIDTNGNIKVGGNAEFAKNVTVKGTLATNVISPIPGNDLTLNLGSNEPGSSASNSQFRVNNSSNSAILTINQTGDLTASGTATFGKLNLNLVSPAFALSNTEVVATGSAGTASIRAYQTQITIDNPQVTEKSLIYVTPKSNQVIYLMRQIPGVSFTVGVSTPTYVDIPFNWIIVN